MIFDEREMFGYADITRGERRRRIATDASRLDRVALGELATESGQNLYRIYRQIASEMREFYTLSFYPIAAEDGKWHELRIGLRSVEGSKRFALTYRQGYQSPPVRRVKN